MAGQRHRLLPCFIFYFFGPCLFSWSNEREEKEEMVQGVERATSTGNLFLA